MSHFYIVKTVVLPLRNSANMPASRLPAPNGPNFTRLAKLFLKIRNGSKTFYELLRPISTHTERPSNFIKILLVLVRTYWKGFLNELLLKLCKNAMQVCGIFSNSDSMYIWGIDDCQAFRVFVVISTFDMQVSMYYIKQSEFFM